MLDPVDELLASAFEGKTKTHEPRALGYIDKAAGADHAAHQTRDIHVAVAIDLARHHERGVETAAVVEIKLAGVRDDRGWIRRDAEVDATAGDAAVDARFDRQRNRVGEPRLGQRRADAVARNAGADVDDVAAMQESYGPAADGEPVRKFRARQLGTRGRRDKFLIKIRAV